MSADRLTALTALYMRVPLLGYQRPLSDEEWLHRFDARIKERSAYAGNYSEADNMRGAVLVYRGVSSYKDAPERAAEEEMSNWGPGEFDDVQEQS